MCFLLGYHNPVTHRLRFTAASVAATTQPSHCMRVSQRWMLRDRDRTFRGRQTLKWKGNATFFYCKPQGVYLAQFWLPQNSLIFCSRSFFLLDFYKSLSDLKEQEQERGAISPKLCFFYVAYFRNEIFYQIYISSSSFPRASNSK